MINFRTLLLIFLVFSPGTRALNINFVDQLENETPESYLTRQKKIIENETNSFFNTILIADQLFDKANSYVVVATFRLDTINKELHVFKRLPEEIKATNRPKYEGAFAAVLIELNIARTALTALRGIILDERYPPSDWINSCKSEFNDLVKIVKEVAQRLLDTRNAFSQQAEKTIALYHRPNQFKEFITKISDKKVSSVIFHDNDPSSDGNNICQLLADAFENIPNNVETLELSVDSVSEEGLILIAGIIKTNTVLKCVNLRTKPLTEKSAQALLTALKSNGRPIDLKIKHSAALFPSAIYDDDFVFIPATMPVKDFCTVSKDTRDKIIRQLRFNNEYPQFLNGNTRVLELFCCSKNLLPEDIITFVIVPILFELRLLGHRF